MNAIKWNFPYRGWLTCCWCCHIPNVISPSSHPTNFTAYFHFQIWKVFLQTVFIFLWPFYTLEIGQGLKFVVFYKGPYTSYISNWPWLERNLNYFWKIPIDSVYYTYVWKSFWVFQTLLIWQCLLRSSKREEPNILNSAYPSIEGLLNCQCTT